MLDWLKENVPLFATLWSGGPVMIPILLSSVIGTAAFLERLWSTRNSRVAPRRLATQVITLARQGRFEEALGACRGSESALARILEAGLEMRGNRRVVIKERLEEAGRREAVDLERFLWVVGVVGALGPLLGLLGTVGGMIITFYAVQKSDEGDINALAGGIAQALIATFAGLMVAIPAVVAHRFLLNRLDRSVAMLEESSLSLLEHVAVENKDVLPGPHLAAERQP